MGITATPQNAALAALSRALRSARDTGDKVDIPILGGLGSLFLGKSPEELEEWSYGNAPMHVPAMTRIPQVKQGRKQQLADTAFLGLDASPLAAAATRTVKAVPAALRHGAESFALAQSPAHVVKPKGGSWLSGSVEDALRGLKRPTPVSREELEALTPERRELWGGAYPVTNHDINQWIERQLAKYVETRMASPEDEVRKLAEQGVLHYDPNLLMGQGYQGPSLHRMMAKEHGKEMAVSDAAKKWEDASDMAIMPVTYRGSVPLQTHPAAMGSALSKLGGEYAVANPDALAYAYNTGIGQSMRGLGFPHLIDELSNALNPNSGLPRNLLLTPEAMKQLSMEKAVRRVAEINAWRAEQAALAEKKAAEEILKREALRSYDDQWRWLSIPDTSTPGGMALAKDLGCRGGWCTQGESAALQYGSKGNRLHVLIDPEGRPHAQIQVEKGKKPSNTYDWFISLSDADKATLLGDRAKTPWDIDDVVKASEAWANRSVPLNIRQIKPPENSWGGSRVAEYTKRDPNYRDRVQTAMRDFVRNSPLGGQWSDVGDLENTGLWRNPKTGTFHTKAEAEADEALGALYDSRNLGPNGEYLGNRFAQGGSVETSPDGAESVIMPASWDVFFTE